jgi:hypothetical protein
MVEIEQQQQQQFDENSRWIGGSILINNFEDNYDLDDLINQ